MEKVATGISGLDRMLNGGIPANHTVAVCGGPGTGKTLLSFEYLYHGAKDYNQPGLFVSLVEAPRFLLNNLRATFSEWTDIDTLINEGKLFISKPDTFDLVNIADMIEKYILEHSVRRVVIDSANVLRINFDNVTEYRQTVQEFLNLLSGMNCTTFMTYELPRYSRENQRFSVEQFISDGIIDLYYIQRQEKRVRALEILKMRGTGFIEDLVPFRITSHGLEVYVGEKIY